MEMANLLSVIDGALYNSIGYFFVAMGVVISIRFSGFPDLTVDGSFTFGAVFYAALVAQNASFLVGMGAALLAGGLAGFCTAALNQWLGLSKIISSVIIMIILILLAPYVADGATISLLNSETTFSTIRGYDIRFSRWLFPDAPFSFHWLYITLWAIPLSVISLLFFWFFKTRIGILVRYMGSAKSPVLVPRGLRKQMILLGLILGNSLIALGGAIEVERNGGFTQSMGVGVLVIGLTIMILGESVQKARLKRKYLHVHEQLGAIVIGVLGYAVGVQLLLATGFLSSLDLKLLTAILLLFLLVYAARKFPSSESFF